MDNQTWNCVKDDCRQVKTMVLGSIQLLVAILCVMGAGLLHAQNLATNGGFESGHTSGWAHSTAGSGRATFAAELSQPYSGTRALRVAVTALGADPWNIQTLGPTFTNLGTGRETTITFRARAAANGTRVRMVMQDSSYQWRDFTLSTSWTYFIWNHTSAEASPRLRIQYPTLGTVWLDDISVVAHSTPASGILVTLDPSIRHQIMDGIGGALTWNANRIIDLPTQKRNEVENMLFDDLGLDIIRLKNWYFPANYPTNKSPSNMEPSWMSGNHKDNKAFYDMAKKNGRNISVLLSSWTPPPNLKTNNSLYNGGTLKRINGTSGRYMYTELGQYWMDLLDNTTWVPDYLSFQNEPGWVAAHETAVFAPTETTTSAGYAQAIDAIYNRIKTRPKVPILIGSEAENMQAFLADIVPLRTRPHVGICAFHNYNVGTPTATNSASVISALNSIRSETTNATSGRPNWMSEFSKGEFDWLDTAHLIHNTLVEANSSAYIYWALAWSSDTTPATAHSERVISLDTSGNYARGNTYFTLKHYAKHISSGHQRFEVTNAAGTNENIRASGFTNPAGNQVTLIVLNTGTTDDTISLRFRGLPVTTATGFRTRQFDIGSSPYHSLGTINLANNQTISKNSINTYVINLAGTLNPYNPSLLRVDGIRHLGNQVAVTMPSQPGQRFVLWKSTTLAAGSWQRVTNAVATESDGQLILTDPTPGTSRAFYRVEHD